MILKEALPSEGHKLRISIGKLNHRGAGEYRRRNQVNQDDRLIQILGLWGTNADVVSLKDQLQAINNHEVICHDLENSQYEVKIQL